MTDAGYITAGFVLTAGAIVGYLATLRSRVRRFERVRALVAPSDRGR